MATSGITVLPLSRDDIVNAALRKLVVIGEGQTANANQLITGTQALNNVVAEFRTLGMSIWARKGLDITLVSGQSLYTFGTTQPSPYNVAYPLHIYLANLMVGPQPFYSKIQLNQMSFTDFSWLPAGSNGSPVNFMYKPNVNFGEMRIWPTPDSTVPTGSVIHIEYQTPFEYFVASTDTPNFPEEWNNALIYNTAMLLCDDYGVSTQRQQSITQSAGTHLATALSNGTEDASMFFGPDWRSMQK